jgi:hypothetical protein
MRPSNAKLRIARESAVQSLAVRTGTSLAEAQTLFDDEFARLGHGATVQTYLHLLAESNVHARLRAAGRTARGTEEPAMCQNAKR